MENVFQQGNPSDSDEKRQDDNESDQQQNRKYIVNDLFSDSDEEEKRIVRTEKEKRWGKLKEIKNSISQKMKINDFNALYTEFENLTKEYEKSKRVVEKEGVPIFYIATLYLLQTYLTNYPNEEKKKLSQTNNKSFNKMKHQLKKYNVQFQTQIDEYEKNPVDPNEESEEEQKDGQKQEGSDEEEKGSKQSKEDEDDDDLSDQQSSSSESDEDERKQYLKSRQTNDPMERRKFWLKKVKDEGDEELEQKQQDEEEEQELEKLKKKNDERRRLNKLKEEQTLANLGVKQQIVIDTSPQAVSDKIHEIVENRSKKNNLKEYYETLTVYKRELKFTKKIDELEILYLYIQVSLDHGKNQATGYLGKQIWNQILNDLSKFLDILIELKSQNQEIQILKFAKEFEAKEANIYEALCANFLILEQELNFDFIKLDATQQYPEYQLRINDLYKLLKLAKRIQDYFQQQQQTEKVVRIAFKRLQNLYYIHDNTLKQLREQAEAAKIDTKDQVYSVLNTEELIQQLALLVYKQGDDDNSLQTTLYLVYHHSIHGRTTKARDILLMNDFPDIIKNQNTRIQVLYNRILIQMGLAYFKEGNLEECKDYLELFYKDKTQKIRDLIGQPYRTIDTQEKKKFMLPYHQFINVELIEACYYLSVIIINSSSFLSNQLKQMNYYFNGPSETNKDFIVDAARFIATGNWKQAFQTIEKISLWSKFNECQQIKDKVLMKIKEQSYKNYVIYNINCFELLNLSKMSEVFSLDSNLLINLTSKLIYNRGYAEQNKSESKDVQLNLKKINNEYYIEFNIAQKTELQKLSAKLLENVQKSTEIIEQKIGEHSGVYESKKDDQNKGDKVKKYTKRIYGVNLTGQKNYKMNKYGNRNKRQY